MVPLLKYYSHNSHPNDEELKAAIDIAQKSKSVILLYYACEDLTNDTDVNHVFVHKDDTLESLKKRVEAKYEIF